LILIFPSSRGTTLFRGPLLDHLTILRLGADTMALHLSPTGPRRSVLRVEAFEERAQPSSSAVMHPNAVVQPLAFTGPSSGLTPSEVRHAYGFDQLADNGAGQTIAIVTAYDDPNISQDLATFDQAYGLAAPPSFVKHMLSAGTRVDGDWAGETALDVEWAHAIAPQAKILLVEARSASTNDLLAAIDYARNQAGVSVVSMSWGGDELSAYTGLESHFATPAGHTPVAFVAAAGDSGAGAEWPASSPSVLAVGGSRLSIGSGGSYSGESAWSGSGGGFSRIFSVPSFQSKTVTGHRAVPDVAYVGDPNSGVAVFSSLPDSGGRSGWEVVGGTSAGSPQWAGLIALTDQERAAHGKANLGRVADTLYTLSASDFHDITAGGNGYATRVGYDLVTGLGTPVANRLIPDLAGVTPTTTTITPPPTTTTTGTGTTGTTKTGTGTGTTTTTPPPTTSVSIPIYYVPGIGWVVGGFGWNFGWGFSAFARW
jgi:subtilase family serine protease